jgi:molecular chaperone GrpE (heat shock protein)
MDDAKILIDLAEKNIGAFAVLAILLLVRYQDRRETRQSEDAQRDDLKEQSLIDVLKGFVKSFSTMAEKFTESLAEQTTAMQSISTATAENQTLLTGARRELQLVIDAQKQLQEGIDKMPDAIQARLVGDFESIGDTLSDLHTRSGEIHNNVTKALQEWATTGARLQRYLEVHEKVEPGDIRQDPDPEKSEVVEEKIS